MIEVGLNNFYNNGLIQFKSKKQIDKKGKKKEKKKCNKFPKFHNKIKSQLLRNLRLKTFLWRRFQFQIKDNQINL